MRAGRLGPKGGPSEQKLTPKPPYLSGHSDALCNETNSKELGQGSRVCLLIAFLPAPIPCELLRRGGGAVIQSAASPVARKSDLNRCSPNWGLAPLFQFFFPLHSPFFFLTIFQAKMPFLPDKAMAPAASLGGLRDYSEMRAPPMPAVACHCLLLPAIDCNCLPPLFFQGAPQGCRRRLGVRRTSIAREVAVHTPKRGSIAPADAEKGV